MTRALAALGCIAVLVWCTAIGPAAAHLDLGIPVLIFTFLATLTPLLLCLPESDPLAQPLAFLSIGASFGALRQLVHVVLAASPRILRHRSSKSPLEKRPGETTT